MTLKGQREVRVDVVDEEGEVAVGVEVKEEEAVDELLRHGP